MDINNYFLQDLLLHIRSLKCRCVKFYCLRSQKIVDPLSNKDFSEVVGYGVLSLSRANVSLRQFVYICYVSCRHEPWIMKWLPEMHPTNRIHLYWSQKRLWWVLQLLTLTNWVEAQKNLVCECGSWNEVTGCLFHWYCLRVVGLGWIIAMPSCGIWRLVALWEPIIRRNVSLFSSGWQELASCV
jgi:hypothetical protein